MTDQEIYEYSKTHLIERHKDKSYKNKKIMFEAMLEQSLEILKDCKDTKEDFKDCSDCSQSMIDLINYQDRIVTATIKALKELIRELKN